jgi:KaiC/GvpD/RAD55 family RecA-like ATPase
LNNIVWKRFLTFSGNYCENYFNTSYDNNCLWNILHKANLEFLVNRARELEKKYEWLQASEYYRKSSDFALREKDFVKAAELLERLAFCLQTGAYQSQTNLEFRKQIKRAIRAYKKEAELLAENKGENKQVKIKHANAWVAYVKSLLEKNPSKKKSLLADWWALENQVLSAYELASDFRSAGKVCNDLLEYSSYGRFWYASDYLESESMKKEGISLAEKVIQMLSQLDEPHELARAYGLASWYYSWSVSGRSEDEIKKCYQKCIGYSESGLKLSQKTNDPWLIGWSYIMAYAVAQFCRLNPALAVEYGKKAIEYGRITKSPFLIGAGNAFTVNSIVSQAPIIEDPDVQRESLKKAKKMAEESIRNHAATQRESAIWVHYLAYGNALTSLASIETDSKTKQETLEMASIAIEEGIDLLRGWRRLSSELLLPLSRNLCSLSEVKIETEEKRKLLDKALYYVKEYIAFHEESHPFAYLQKSRSYSQLALVQSGLADITIDKKKKIKLLHSAVESLEKCIELSNKTKKIGRSSWGTGILGRWYSRLGKTLYQMYLLTKEEEKNFRVLDAYENASIAFKESDLPVHMAESYWHIAQLHDQMGEPQRSSKSYELASEAYDLAADKIPQLSNFYKNYSTYMLAWNQLEQARYNHSIEDYDKAKQQYEKAAELHESTEFWIYLAPNYYAWANLEEGESLSRKENAQQAKETFQKALEQFNKAEDTIKQKIGGLASAEEKDLVSKLLQSSDLRRKLCQARIQIEEAKLLDRRGKYLQSSKSYEEAAQKLESIIENTESEAERKELELLARLCRAWQKMADAEETTSSDSYLEAAALFENAKEYCYTKKASLWALGNSNFCRGLAAGLQYKATLDLADHAKAKGYIKNASIDYLQAGFASASEYAKATQRLFDAYIFINQAEGEIDQEKRAKQYQTAENLLEIAAGSFMKAKQPEKTGQVQQILKSVREEKALAVSLNEVLHAPTATSSTMSFTAPTPTSEASVGLESFEHANVQANLVVGLKEVRVGESFCLSVEFVNAGKEPALLMRVEDFVPPDFIVAKKPEIYRLEESCLNMKGKQIAPLKLVEAKLVLQPSQKGVYQFKPTVHYLDELGQNKSLQLKSVEIKVEEVILSDRVSTGTRELDSLLLGGIPEGYTVVLTGSPSDERELLIRNFLEAGIKEEQTSFYVTAETVGFENLFEKTGFYLFLCNPKPKKAVPDLPNITWLKSKTDLNNLNMALVRASRNLQQKQGVKRIIIGNVSDVLLKDGPEVTRRWLSELVTDLGSKGFTILAVLDPSMHPVDQANAIINLFDGEINLTQTGVPPDCKKSLLIKKLRGQDYIKNPICLTI